mmetsp:Transcript_32317/g.74440  ORF Transcript_32317/g.74440 Transcript_32317/m.74440 type:complete len:344 (-) Transcript_32317:182-1213(-)
MVAVVEQPAATPAGGPNDENRPVSIDTQHNDMIHDVQLDYYGCKLATASSDRTVKIFDVANDQYTHTATLQGHEGPVWEVAWAHPKFGVLLTSCSFDGTVMVHREINPGKWAVLHTHRLHESSVNSVAFAPHEFGLMLAAASSDGRVSVLSHRDDDTWAVLSFSDNALGVNSVSWAPYCGSSDSGEEPKPRLVTGGCDNRIRFWKLAKDVWEEETGAAASSLEGVSGPAHTDWVRDVAWAPIQNVIASCSEDRTVLIWTRGEKDRSFIPTLLHTFEAPVWRLSWSITGNILAVSSGDSSVTLWKQDMAGTWEQVSTVEDTTAADAQPTHAHTHGHPVSANIPY